MGRWWRNDTITTKYTGWILWRQGYKLNPFELRRLLDPKVLRTIMQVNKNIFYNIENNNQYKYICPCDKVWSSNHRLKYPSCPAKQLRIFSIRNHEIYYRNRPYDVDKYITDIETANNNIKNQRKLEVNQVSAEMWDNYEPQKITLENKLTWIRNKLELKM